MKIEATTNSSITILLKPNPGETEPIHGYTVRYKPDFAEIENIQVPASVEKYTIENLWCGSRYQISAVAYNGYCIFFMKTYRSWKWESCYQTFYCCKLLFLPFFGKKATLPTTSILIFWLGVGKKKKSFFVFFSKKNALFWKISYNIKYSISNYRQKWFS